LNCQPRPVPFISICLCGLDVFVLCGFAAKALFRFDHMAVDFFCFDHMAVDFFCFDSMAYSVTVTFLVLIQPSSLCYLLIVHFSLFTAHFFCYNETMETSGIQVFIPATAKSDVIFKALFGDELNKAFLISFLQAVVKAGH